MIVIIDTRYDKSYHSKYKSHIARKICVNRITIARWIKGGKKIEKYNHYKIYLESEEV